jgi:hypothetical protein
VSLPGATIRYAIHENGYTIDAIHAHRVRRPSRPGMKLGRRCLMITTLGRDIATVSLEFDMCSRAMPARPRQTWVRFPNLGWKLTAAHVPVTEASTGRCRATPPPVSGAMSVACLPFQTARQLAVGRRINIR